MRAEHSHCIAQYAAGCVHLADHVFAVVDLVAFAVTVVAFFPVTMSGLRRLNQHPSTLRRRSCRA
jgi:hypothetical protein